METCTWYDYATFCIDFSKRKVLLNLIKNVGIAIEKQYHENGKFYCDSIFKHENGKCPKLTEINKLIYEYNLPIDVTYME